MRAYISGREVLWFVAGVIFGVALLSFIQWKWPSWEYEKLHYQKGQLSVQTLVRYSPYTGSVERLATSEPE